MPTHLQAKHTPAPTAAPAAAQFSARGFEEETEQVEEQVPEVKELAGGADTPPSEPSSPPGDGASVPPPGDGAPGSNFSFLDMPLRAEEAGVQAKLTMGQPGDKYEREADQTAAQVMRMPDPQGADPVENEEPLETETKVPQIQRVCSKCEAEQEKEESLQLKSSSKQTHAAQPENLQKQLARQSSKGNSLPSTVRSHMEPRFGSDFNQVRVHTGSDAVQMTKELGAKAFTYKNNIFYGAGKGPAKDELTAHELTHVIQQTGSSPLNKRGNQQTKQLGKNDDNHQTAKQLSKAAPITAQNKLLSSSLKAPSVQAKAEPGQTLDRLKNTPPTEISNAHNQAQSESSGAWQSKKNELESELPEIPAPTGLPAKKADAKKLKQQKQNEATQIAKLKEAKPKKAETKKEKAAESQRSDQIYIKEPPPSKPITPTRLQDGDSEQNDEKLSRDAQNELDNVELDTSQISTDAGPPPTVDLTGDADPEQVDTSQQDSDKEVRQAKAEAEKDIQKDFGENDIYPEASNEKLRAKKLKTKKQQITTKIRKGKEKEAPTIPGEAAGALNSSAGPGLQEKIGTEKLKYDTGKQQFDQDVNTAKVDSDDKIKSLDEEAKKKQIQEQEKAKSDVEASRTEWQVGIDEADQEYQRQADEATQEQRRKINDEHDKGNRDAQKHFDDAERDAETEKQKAERDADREKGSAERESGGFIGWVQSTAQRLIDGLKEAINFIFEQLREAVKAIFEAAKELALDVIEFARQAIVDLIEAFGDILQRLVDVVFAAFPALAERINRAIDRAVNAAVEAVNAAAEALKQGVTAALDFLANAVDQLLAGIQAIYNAVLDGIGMLVNGILDMLQRLGYLIEAATQMPDHFMGQLSEEVLGMDLSQPLPFERSPESCQNPAAVGASGGDPQAEALLNKSSFTEDDFMVDQVAPFDVSPELLESMNLAPGEEKEFGHSNDPANSMDAIKAELTGGSVEEGMASAPISGEEQGAGATCDDPAAIEAQFQELLNQPVEGASSKEKKGEPAQQGDIPEHMRTVGPLSVGQRARYMSHQMIQGVKQWFSANWPYLLAGAIAGIAAFIGLNILTGGAISAALPPLMTIIGAIMIGVAMVRIGGYVGKYLTQGWGKQTAAAAKSLARALAIGAVELIFALLFNAGTVIKALRGGVKATAKAAGKAAKNTVRSTTRSAKQLGQISRQGAKATLKNGKIMLRGAKGGFSKGAKSLDDLVRRLGNRLRFNKFKVKRQGQRVQLFGHINPWILLANGDVYEVDASAIPGARLGDQVTTSVGTGKVIATEAATRPARSLTTPRRVTPTGTAKDIHYGALDLLGLPAHPVTKNWHGRATGAHAVLTNPLGRGTPASRLSIPGFIQGQGHARGHLIAQMLGGFGNERRNLVTLLQQPVNTPAMRELEGLVRRAVDNGETVWYTVTPIYRNNIDHMPDSIRLIAHGIKDGKQGLSFDVAIRNTPGLPNKDPLGEPNNVLPPITRPRSPYAIVDYYGDAHSITGPINDTVYSGSKPLTDDILIPYLER